MKNLKNFIKFVEPFLVKNLKYKKQLPKNVVVFYIYYVLISLVCCIFLVKSCSLSLGYDIVINIS